MKLIQDMLYVYSHMKTDYVFKFDSIYNDLIYYNQLVAFSGDGEATSNHWAAVANISAADKVRRPLQNDVIKFLKKTEFIDGNLLLKDLYYSIYSSSAKYIFRLDNIIRGEIVTSKAICLSYDGDKTRYNTSVHLTNISRPEGFTTATQREIELLQEDEKVELVNYYTLI